MVIKSNPTKNLAYFASGTKIKSEYEHLPFQNIFLIDKGFRKTYSKNKVHCLGMDAIESIKYFLSKAIKLDCVVILNEGLYEGGGRYPLNSDLFIGYLIPILRNSYIHISYPNYYHGDGLWKIRDHFLDIPYSKTLLSESDNLFIDPNCFSEQCGNKASVWFMEKIHTTPFLFKINQVECRVHRSSIWEYEKNYDALFVYTNQGCFNYLEFTQSNIFDITDLNFKNLLNLSLENRWSNIGLIPWNKGSYEMVQTELTKWHKDYPKTIVFHHLNKNDFITLKEIKV